MGLLISYGEIRNCAFLLKSRDIYCGFSNDHENIGTDFFGSTGNRDHRCGPGKLIFPGFIDPHVHPQLPFMATFAQGYS